MVAAASPVESDGVARRATGIIHPHPQPVGESSAGGYDLPPEGSV